MPRTYSRETTTNELLEGVSLAGRRVLVTGGSEVPATALDSVVPLVDSTPRCVVWCLMSVSPPSQGR